MPSEQQETSYSDVITLLESRTLAFYTATNTRNFDTSLPPWTYLAPSFSCNLNRSGIAEPTTPLAHSETLRNWCVEHPTYHMQPSDDAFNTRLDERGQFAEVWVTFTTTGEVEGVAKEEVGKFVWKKEKHGEWIVTLAQCLVGV